MRSQVRTILITLTCLLVVGATRAAAQSSDGRVYFAAVYDLFFHVPDETSSLGMHLDVSKRVYEKTGTSIYALGEVGFNRFEVVTASETSPETPSVTSSVTSSYLGGGRIAGRINPKMTPFFQFLVGIQHEHCCAENYFAFQPGIGLDYAWTPKVALRAQIDFRRAFFTDHSQSETRIGFGVVIPLRVD